MARRKLNDPVVNMGNNDMFSKCEFVPTEVNHDLNPPIGTKLMKNNQNIRSMYKTFLDDGIQGCRNFDTTQFNNDDMIVQTILGLSIEQILNLEQGVEIPRQVVTKTVFPSNSQSTTSQVKIHKCNKNENGSYDSRLFSIFDADQLNEEGIIELFFVIDTGDNLVQTLKGLAVPTGINGLIINVMHSQFTLGDSAPKTLPDSKNYTSSNPSVHLFSWYLTNNLTIPANDPLFMSSIRINSSLSGTAWKVRQDWNTYYEGRTQLVYQTFDSKKENSKPLASKYLATNLPILENSYVIGDTPTTVEQVTTADNNALRTNNLLKTKKIQMDSSITILKKRSGDHGQVKYCNDLLTTYFNSGNFIKVRSSIENNYKPFQKNRGYYNKKTFVITGDWPCFAFCIYNKINVIMVFKHPTNPSKSCVIKVSFY